MPRTIGASALARVNKQLATAPLIVIEVNWGLTGPIVRYADADYDGISGKILELSGIDSTIKVGSAGGSNNSMSVTLDDTDGTIKTISNTNDIHKGKVSVYQCYGSLTFADRFLLFKGEINSQIIWNEANKTIKMDIVSFLEDKEIGFSPEEGDLDFISPAAVGVAWPLCFGKPIRVPAIKLTEQVRGSALTRYTLITLGNLSTLCNRAQAVARAESAKIFADQNNFMPDAVYGTIIDNLNSALTAMNIYIGTLSIGAPDKAGSLENYATVCKNLELNELNFARFDAQNEQFQLAIVANNTAINSLGDSILEAQGASPIDIPLINNLQDELASQTSQLASNNIGESQSSVNRDAAATNIVVFTAQRNAIEGSLANFDLSTILVENGDKFPQGVPIQIIIKNVKFAGSFAGNLFTITAANVPYLPGTDTNENTPGAVAGNVNKITVPSGREAKGFYSRTPRGIVFVDSQLGNVGFTSPSLFIETGQLATVPGGLEPNGDPLTREIYEPVNPGSLGITAPLLPSSWVLGFRNSAIPDFASGINFITDKSYSIEFGDTVYLDDSFGDVYVANLIPSVQVFEVVGLREVDGRDVIVPIPTSYYKINLSDSLVDQTPTTIRFMKPLTSYLGEDWTGDVFVTLESTVGNNTSDVLAYLVETYTDLTTDTGSFASVKTDLTGLPSDFALLNRVPALSTIENIAWQARCAAFVSNEVVKLRFLAKDEAAEGTFSEANVLNETFDLTYTRTEELITKWVGLWAQDYSRKFVEPEEQNKVILRNNIPKYGEIEEEFDIYIYNVETLVQMTTFFWMVRNSSTWKRITFETPLDSLNLEEFDPVDIGFAAGLVADATVKGMVESINYNSDDNTLKFEVWISVRSGEMESYAFAFPFSAAPGLEYPTPTDLYTGGASG